MLVVSQSLGLGLVHHGRKPLKTSQNHNGSQEPETLEALQLLWVAKLGEFLLGISVSDF